MDSKLTDQAQVQIRTDLRIDVRTNLRPDTLAALEKLVAFNIQFICTQALQSTLLKKNFLAT